MNGSDSDPDDALIWVERVAKYCADQDGLLLIAGRVLGWLMICDPPEQIVDAIGVSRASLTTNLRLLGSVGFVSQVTNTVTGPSTTTWTTKRGNRGPPADRVAGLLR